MNNRGQTTVQLVLSVVTGAAALYGFIYSSLFSPLSTNQYKDHASIEGVKVSVQELSKTVDDMQKDSKETHDLILIMAQRQGIITTIHSVLELNNHSSAAPISVQTSSSTPISPTTI